MQNLMNELTKLFQKDYRIFADGKLLKNKLTELALKLDHSLVRLLLSDKKAKEHFFIEQVIKKGKVLVFDKDKFISFVNNKEFLPDSFSSFKNKIGLMTNGDYLKEKSDVVLAWVYKDCVLEGGQDKEGQKRDEIFYNETLAPNEIDRLFEPKVLTNLKRYDSKGKHEVTDFNDDDNLILKGNNLIALHCLKQKFRSQVKLIYIDPPFNTGNDSFKYNDKFNHSTWLTFMKNRLYIAFEFLKSEGNIIVHVDNNESHYIKVLLDEIFGRHNFVNEIVWHKGREGGSSRSHSRSSSMPTEYQNIFIYAKNKKERFWNPILGPYKESTISNIQKDKNGWFYKRGRMGRKPAEWELEEGVSLKTYIFDDTSLTKEKVIKLLTSRNAKYVALGDVWNNEVVTQNKTTKYDTEKPEELLMRLIEAGTKPKDTVLDFFMGSGTTASVSLKLKRRFIGVEQMDKTIDVMLKRLTKVIKGEKKGISKQVKWKGGGSFVYAELKKWNEEYMTKIQEADTARKLLNVYKKMKKEAFFRYDVDLSKFEEKDFEKLSLEEQKQVMCECLDKNHLYVNLSEIDDVTYKVSTKDKNLNKEFYNTVL